MIRLEALPAQKGDCLLLHTESDAGAGLVLIDGGPAGVSSETLIPRLHALRKERRLDDGEPLVIDLAIVSHVDDDHIIGIIDLLEAMLERQQVSDPPQFRVKGLWHNSFDRVLGNDETGGLLSATQFGAASLGPLIEDAEEGPPTDHLEVLASIPKGARLKSLAEALNIPVNGQFGGALIQAIGEGSVAREVAGVDFTVLGPLRPELMELQKKFDKWLKDHPQAERTEPSMLAALDDTSAANLSSIVLLARAGDKTILLTGDARSDKILAGLQGSGVLGEGRSIDVSVLKMPHHGSIRNIDERGEFLATITSTNYVFSGNGEHGNPDRETLELLFKARPNAKMVLHFTYPIAEIDPVRRAVHERERAKRLNKNKPAGLKWSDEKHSLAALLSQAPAGVSVVEDGSPVL